MRRLEIIQISAEAIPYVKSGGLADACGSLCQYLRPEANVTLIIPGYSWQKELSGKKIFSDLLTFAGRKIAFQIIVAEKKKKFRCCLLKSDLFFARKFIYGDSSGDYFDNFFRFLFFQRAVVRFIESGETKYDLIHCHDWQTALIPLYLKELNILPETAKILSIHNLGYQGIFPADYFGFLELPSRYFSPESIEFFGQLNFLKAGIAAADRLLTVSPSYAREILSPQFGFGLDGFLRQHGSKLSGILNGVDYRIWNPSADKFIFKNYSSRRLKAKEENKQKLLKELNLPADPSRPLFVFIGRLVEQKGIHLIIESFSALQREKILLIVLGCGEHYLENDLKRLASANKQKIRFLNLFSEEWAHRLQAAADFLLMPSLYEPCGLNQLYALKYGTLPLAFKTGGLQDSVIDWKLDPDRGTGLLSDNFSAQGVLAMIKTACSMFENRKELNLIRQRAMEQNFGWEKSTREYLQVYRQLIKE